MFADIKTGSEAEQVTAHHGLFHITLNVSNLARKELVEIKPQTVPITLQINILFLLADVHSEIDVICMYMLSYVLLSKSVS